MGWIEKQPISSAVTSVSGLSRCWILIVPAWAGTILFALTASVVGAGHAEQLIISLMLCLGFFSLSYAVRALSPKALRALTL